MTKPVQRQITGSLHTNIKNSSCAAFSETESLPSDDGSLPFTRPRAAMVSENAAQLLFLLPVFIRIDQEH